MTVAFVGAFASQAAEVKLNHADYATDAAAGAALVAACAGASDGDTVTVGAGRWYLSAPIKLSKPITLRAAERADRTKTIIESGGKTNLLSMTAAAYVDGFTFEKGRPQGAYTVWANAPLRFGAVALSRGTMTNCIVRNISYSRTVGEWNLHLAGIGVSLVDRARLVDTVVTDIVGEDHYKSWESFHGCGVFAAGTSTVHQCTIRDCRMFGSYNYATADDTAGAGAFLDTGARMSNCEVAYNIASNVVELTDSRSGGGGGIYAIRAGTVVSNCFIHGNYSAMAGGGVLLGGGAELVDCTISENVARLNPASTATRTAGAGGVSASGTGFKIRRCRILDNQGTINGNNGTAGGGIGISTSSSSALVENCVIRGNFAEGCGGLSISYPNDGIVVSNCVIQANSVTGRGGAGVFVRTSVANAVTLIADSFIVGNWIVSGKSLTASGVGYQAHNGVNGDTLILRNCCLYGGMGGDGAIHGFIGGNSRHYLKVVSCSVYDNRDGGIALYKDGSYYSAMSNMFVYGSVFINNGANGKTNIDTRFNNVTNIWYTYEPNGQWATSQTQYDYHNLKDADFPPGSRFFLDPDNGDYRISKKSVLRDTGLRESWMGKGHPRGQLDMGDGTWTEAKSADYGVRVIRNHAVPRLYGTTSDVGCFECYTPHGMHILFK